MLTFFNGPTNDVNKSPDTVNPALQNNTRKRSVLCSWPLALLDCSSVIEKDSIDDVNRISSANGVSQATESCNPPVKSLHLTQAQCQIVVALLQLRTVTEYDWISAASFTSRRRRTATTTICRWSTVRLATRQSSDATVAVVTRRWSNLLAAISGYDSSRMIVLSTSASISSMNSYLSQRTTTMTFQVYRFTQLLVCAPA